MQVMKRIGRNRIPVTAGAALLALLVWLAGPVWADCCKPMAAAAAMTGCHEESAPAIHPACCGGKEADSTGGCCGLVQAVAPATVTPTPAPAPLCELTSPYTSAEPIQRSAAPVRLPPLPPPLYADVGLYTLHAVFLI